MSAAPETRVERLTEIVADAGLDAVIVGDLVRPGDSNRDSMADVTWLTGFGGSSGIAVIGPDVRCFVTDFRYLTTAAEGIPGSFEIVDATAEMLPTVATLLSGRVGIDESKTSVKSRAKLLEEIEAGTELIGTEDPIADLRRVKDESEIALIAEAARITDAVYSFIEERGLAGRTEREVALAAEAKMRELGADDPSFTSIVAAGENGALPHAVPRDVAIPADTLVTLDIGARVDGYCSDCTRTWATGELADDLSELYATVLDAQETALAAVRPGLEGREVDAIARDLITAAGHGDHFGHGLGHGVGLDVHEAPRLARTAEARLEAGNVVTVEPGIYLPGRGGARIEDLVVVTADGHEVLSATAKSPRVVA